MGRNYDEIVADLDASLPRDVVSTRDAGNGRKLDYVSGYYVIDRLNKVLGIGNWAYGSEASAVFTGEVRNKFSASYLAKVRLVCTIGSVQTEFIDYGYGDGSDSASPGKAHELAVKEAVTDGLKRCAKNLGMSLGLALYDKEQNNVSESSIPQATVQPPMVPARKETENKAKDAGPKESEGDGRKSILSAISAHSRVLIERKVATQEQLISILNEYGVGRKEDLTTDQAMSVLTKLKGMIK